MKDEIKELLARKLRLKRSEIAKHIGKPRKEIGKFLHHHSDIFFQDDEYKWSLVPTSELKICFDAGWVDSETFESILQKSGCPYTSTCQSVRFVMPNGCSIMLEASARMLALCNQLVSISKEVTLDFTGNLTVLSYLNRCGFLDQLHKDVQILPAKPRVSKAKRYLGNNKRLIEIREINPVAPDMEIPVDLKKSFVAHAGDHFSTTALTVFGELFSNVCDHSETELSGFAGLQVYRRTRPHIQTVVSDSGIGILASLKPVLRQCYPEILREYDLTDPNSGLHLIEKMMVKGGITRRPEGASGGGGGLKQSHAYGKKYKAKISVRQKNSELVITYVSGKTGSSLYKTGLPTILGTHVCFDFFLD